MGPDEHLNGAFLSSTQKQQSAENTELRWIRKADETLIIPL